MSCEFNPADEEEVLRRFRTVEEAVRLADPDSDKHATAFQTIEALDLKELCGKTFRIVSILALGQKPDGKWDIFQRPLFFIARAVEFRSVDDPRVPLDARLLSLVEPEILNEDLWDRAPLIRSLTLDVPLLATESIMLEEDRGALN